MPDLGLLVTEILFAILFGASLWRAIRSREPLAWDIVLVFTPLAALFVVQLATDAVGPLPAWLGIVTGAFVLAQPVFSLRLVSRIRPLRRFVMPLATAAFAGPTIALILVSPAPAPAALLAISAFIVTEAVAAGYLALEARARSGSAGIRLAIAAFATGALALAIFVAAVAAAVALPEEVSGFITRAIALAAAIGYVVAFLPPAWLRRAWHATESYAHNEILFATPPSTATLELWVHLAEKTHELTGAGSVILSRHDDGRVHDVATSGVDLRGPLELHEPTLREDASIPTDAVVAEIAARTGGGHVIPVQILRDGMGIGIVCLVRSRPSLFDADDAALVRSLAARTANLVQRRDVLAGQERLGEQLRNTVAALEAASAAKSDFLASMSHELRTPLNAIIGFSELMIADAGDADTVTVPREWVDHIRNGGTHLVALINDVLDLAKVEAGRLELTTSPVELGHAVAESVAGLRPLADRKRQRLTVAVESVTIEVDPGRLRQILYNLLSNAIKYTDDDGSIAITAAQHGDVVRIGVQDTGVGIASEDQPHVFEEFRQVGTSSAHVAGTGLGLALTKRLAEAHGGSIEVVSELGVGSTFTVILPVGSPTPTEDPGPRDVASISHGSARVLVIEDDPSSVRLLQAYLVDGGYDVTVAADGESGLDAARADPPAAILLDVLLPGIDGWEVLRRLKSDPRVRDVPVVMVTVVDERNVGLALGAVDYFVKPIEREALVARLGRHTFTTKVRTRSMGVLAIDDDPAALAMIEATLAPLGFEVHLETSGERGIAQAARIRPDLIICDLSMPGLDGFEVVARLNADPTTTDIPILILTSHELTDADKARLNGQVLGVVDKGDSAAQGLLEWLARVIPGEPLADTG